MGIAKGKVLVACVAAAIVAISMAGCSTAASTVENELNKRGFTNITLIDSFVEDSVVGNSASYYVSYGKDCRFLVEYHEKPESGESQLTLIEESTQGSEFNLVVPNPTAVKVGALDALQYCTPPEASAEEE